MAKHTTYIDENGRVCTTCHKYKEWKDFGISSSSSTGHCASCYPCMYLRGIKNKRNKDKKKVYKRHRTIVKEEIKQKYEPPCIDLIIDRTPIVHEEEYLY